MAAKKKEFDAEAQLGVFKRVLSRLIKRCATSVNGPIEQDEAEEMLADLDGIHMEEEAPAASVAVEFPADVSTAEETLG